MIRKKIEKWTAADFKREARRLNDGGEIDGDETLCLAMILMSLCYGPSLKRLAKGLGVEVARLEWMHANLTRNGVFKRGRVRLGDGPGDEDFVAELWLTTAVGLGYMDRVTT